MSCLVAQTVAHFKTRSPVGGFYLYPAGTRNAGEEFIYEVAGAEGDEPHITCWAVHGVYETPRTLEELYRGDAE